MAHYSLRRQTPGAVELYRTLAEPIPYKRIKKDKVKLLKRSVRGRFNDQARLQGMNFVAERY